MATIEDLLSWIEADLDRFAPARQHVQVVSDVTEPSPSSAAVERRLILALYTTQSRYRIAAVERLPGGPFKRAGVYLGAQVSSRAPRPGEDHTRGRDLADGPLSQDTWRRVLADIVACELVRVHAPRTLGAGPMPPPLVAASPGGV
jgi:hypothetical protein